MKLDKRIPVDDLAHDELKEFAAKHNISQRDAIMYLLGHVKESHGKILKEIIDTLLPHWKKILDRLKKKDKDSALVFLNR